MASYYSSKFAKLLGKLNKDRENFIKETCVSKDNKALNLDTSLMKGTRTSIIRAFSQSVQIVKIENF